MQPNVPAPGRDDERFDQSALKVAHHLRRYSVLYAVGALAAIAVALFPSLSPGQQVATADASAAGANTGGVNFGGPAGGTTSSGGGAGDTGASGAASGAAGGGAGGAAGSGAGGSSGAAGAGGAAGGQAGSAGAAGGQGGAAATRAGGGQSSATQQGGGGASTTPGAGGGGGGGGVNTVVVGSGTTISGAACSHGVRQLPYSQYADPCEAHFTGNNGGATYNGVTAKDITIAVRVDADANGANAQAVDTETQAAGGVSRADNYGFIQKMIPEFNKNFELYGRQVKLAQFNGQGNGTNESLGQGQAAACADADTVANSLHAFGDFNYGGVFESGPFADCAARYHIYVPEGAPYFPETDYKQWTPYVWGITMQCDLISQETSEFIGKQLFPFKAKWAGNDGVQSMAGTDRKFATYIPNNAGYQDCANVASQQLQQKYHVPANRLDQYNYALDISTFPQDAQRAIVQFSANRDTDIILACDPISPIFLTQDALKQNYFPEWVLNGVALTDSDNYAQLWDQNEVTGRLFGLSQAGSTKAGVDPNGEAAKFLTAAGVPVNPSTVVDYYELISMFNQLQAAGPNLTPANIAAGTAQLPVAGGPTGASGTWHFGSTHTAIIDSREIYYNASGTSDANGRKGTYVAIFNGNRFGADQFPGGEPPFFS